MELRTTVYFIYLKEEDLCLEMKLLMLHSEP